MWYLYFRRIALAVFAVFIGAVLALFLVVCNSFPVNADTERDELNFPFVIGETDLIAECFIRYEGDYIEDKSDTFLVDGAALCVYNQGDKHIDFASVYIETLEGVYCFEGTCIPPKTKVMILEKYKSSYPTGPVCIALGRTVFSEKQNILEKLHIAEVDMGSIKVTNCSDTYLENVNLYYKQYDSHWGTCIGGITYVVSPGDLQPGESTYLYPANFAKGYSKFLYATKQ